ncbi:MAG: ATP-binding protein, partial [Spirochaetaceae bacterium]|nr:ATP-binding protein [Spirochaetaceae bacterium]
IGLSEKYAGVCGITETELLDYFTPELEALAKKNGESFEETLALVRQKFNGYHFCENSEGVFNPFSLLNTFDNQRINYYWFATGTPTFLFGELKRTGFDIIRFDNKIDIDAFAINDYQPGDSDPVPLLYQSGYLTITGFDKNMGSYRLGFPNEEVKYGFLANLFKYFFPENGAGNGLNARTFVRALNSGDAETFLEQLKAFFAAVPYDLYFAKGESYYQTIFYLVFTLMGQFVQSEVRSAAGRADAVVKTAETVYVFEFKVDGSAENALRQIDEKGYMIPYIADGRRLVKAGVVFDSGKRTLGEWRLAKR